MYLFDKLRQYTQVTNALKFPKDPKRPYLFLYMSENSTFIDDYKSLNLRLIDFRDVVVPLTKIPRTRLTTDLIKLYKSFGLIARNSNMKIPAGRNIIYDLTQYLKSIDTVYEPRHYRQRSGLLIKNLLLRGFDSFPNNYKKVLVYSVTLENNLYAFPNRKIFPLLYQLKTGSIPYDYLLLVSIHESKPYYRLLVKDKEYNLNKIIPYLKKIKMINTEEEEEKNIEDVSKKIVSSLKDEIPESDTEKVVGAIATYLKKNPSEVDNVSSGKASKSDMEKIATTSILYKVSGDLDKSERISKSVPKEKSKTALKAVSKKFSDDLLEPQKTTSSSQEVSVQINNPPKMVDDKSPEHIFQKRQIDFEKNLTKDMTNSFKVLEKKEIPLKVKKVEIVDKPQRAGELEQTDISILKCVLADEKGNEHVVELEMPKIDSETGTFRVNGRRKCLINQIVLCPISFPKPYDSKFESSYSAFHIWSKRTKAMNFLEVYIASYTLPYSIFLFYSFGFEETLKRYGIKYTFSDTRPKKEEVGSRIAEGKFIIFSNVDTDLKTELCNSFIRAGVSSHTIKSEFGTKKYFNDLIISITGRINSTFLINSNLENIVDPVATQILVNKQLPSELETIMHYMSSKVVTGHVEERNDLSNQRIRNSEVLVHLAQKRILASYTEYKEKVLAGNKKAPFNIPSDSVLRDFNLSQVVADMEYANPVEEMAVMTRVTPVGKGIGGIPDKLAVQLEGRNVHPSYFGNIDPLDTPESDNIGITQQLTIDALITSARGLFSTKEMTEHENSGILSTTTCMIPFIENNDGARVMMAANQARQALPLKDPEPPIVQSGYESILTNVLSDNYIKKAKCDGKVEDIKDNKLIIKCKNGRKSEIDLHPIHLHSGAGKDTLSVFNTIVKKGQLVKQNQVLAEGSCVNKGSISMGRTLCVALMPYKGINFEDGIAINERLVKDNKLTSIHGVEEEILIEKSDKLLYINQIGNVTKKGEPLVRKTIGEIGELIGYEDEDDETIDITEGQLIKKSPGGKIVDIEVFSNLPLDKFPRIRELVEKTKAKYKIVGREKFTIRGQSIKGVMIKFIIEQELNTEVSDKLCNRHGNKGIISLIEEEKFMPVTPWGDKVDIILNPIGLIGRMNMGQFYELYTGLISRILGLRVKELKDKNRIYALLKSTLPHLDKSKGKEFSSKYLSSFQKLPNNAFNLLVSQVSESGFFPLIIPPFKGPSYKELLNVLKILKLQPGYNLYLPEYKTKTKNVVPVGYQYFYKLEHLGGSKIHGRSTGPMVQKTKQPTGGKRREGGQRLGEADSHSLISYNCTAVLAELFGPLSDDLVTKNEIISDIIQTGSAAYRTPKVSPAKDLLNSYFIALLLQG